MFYCGKEHQLAHWQKGHKEACAPYKISKDPILGRYLEATQNITAGNFIMKSKPLVYGPQVITDLSKINDGKQISHQIFH